MDQLDVYSAIGSALNVTNWSNLVAVTDCGGANLIFLGLVSLGQHNHWIKRH